MKKVILAALVLAAGVFGAEAQKLSPRVEAGAAFSNATINGKSEATKIGARAGAALEISLVPPSTVDVYLAPGLTYKMGGYNMDGESSGHLTTHNLQVPVNFGMRAHFAPAWAASVELGPYVSYALHGCVDGEYNIFEEDKNAKRFDTGLDVSAAIEYHKVYLRIGSEFGFLNQYEAKDNSSKNKSFYTTLGFRF